MGGIIFSGPKVKRRKNKRTKRIIKARDKNNGRCFTLWAGAERRLFPPIFLPNKIKTANKNNRQKYTAAHYNYFRPTQKTQKEKESAENNNIMAAANKNRPLFLPVYFSCVCVFSFGQK